jgi:transposase
MRGSIYKAGQFKIGVFAKIMIGVYTGGIPTHHEIRPGNTVDQKTLESMSTVLRDRFRITNVVFIGDRAFGCDASLKHLDQTGISQMHTDGAIRTGRS